MKAKALILCVILSTFVMLISCSKDKAQPDSVKDSSAITESSTKSTVSAWDDSFQEDSINKLTYIYEGEVGLKWVTDDPQLIHECIDAVKNIKVKKTTQMYAFDAGDRLEFKTKNGEKYTVEFTMGLLVKEQSNYEIEGFSELQKVLDKIKSEGKSVV